MSLWGCTRDVADTRSCLTGLSWADWHMTVQSGIWKKWGKQVRKSKPPQHWEIHTPCAESLTNTYASHLLACKEPFCEGKDYMVKFSVSLGEQQHWYSKGELQEGLMNFLLVGMWILELKSIKSYFGVLQASWRRQALSMSLCGLHLFSECCSTVCAYRSTASPWNRMLNSFPWGAAGYNQISITFGLMVPIFLLLDKSSF